MQWFLSIIFFLWVGGWLLSAVRSSFKWCYEFYFFNCQMELNRIYFFACLVPSHLISRRECDKNENVWNMKLIISFIFDTNKSGIRSIRRNRSKESLVFYAVISIRWEGHPLQGKWAEKKSFFFSFSVYFCYSWQKNANNKAALLHLSTFFLIMMKFLFFRAFIFSWIFLIPFQSWLIITIAKHCADRYLW